MKKRFLELARYGINGLVATTINYLVLFLGVEFFHLQSIAFAGSIAAFCGITSSFIGSRYFVFPATEESVLVDVLRFSGLYITIAFLQVFILFIWSDWLLLDYTIGFVIATILQVVISYFGNKYFVFKS